jgi:hypothetical protein
MNNFDHELRELLRAKADEIAPHEEVPRGFTRRARRRIARNVAVVAATVVVVVAGAFTGVQALDAPDPNGTIRPATTPSLSVTPSPSATEPSPQQTPSESSAPECASSQLRAVGALEGAAGSREGAISLSNLSDQACTLQGTPTIAVFDDNLQPITTGVEFDPSPAGWVVDGSPTPPGWPVVTLAQRGGATVRIRWSNWCPDGRPAPLWRVELPDGGTLNVQGLDAAVPPPCNGPGQPSTIEVGPFEPGR